MDNTEKKQSHGKPADEKPCDKCGTVIHVGVASGRGVDDANLCLSCMHCDDRLHCVYNLWSVIDAQRFVPE